MCTCEKFQLITHNQSWDMDILNSNKYCILRSISLMHVKIKIWKTALKLLYIIDYLFLMTLNEILTCGKILLCTHNQRWDIQILKSDCYCLLCFIALIHVKIKI